jgi:hypothetical protein
MLCHEVLAEGFTSFKIHECFIAAIEENIFVNTFAPEVDLSRPCKMLVKLPALS